MAEMNSVAAPTIPDHLHTGPVVRLRLDELRRGPSVRQGDVKAAYVESLAELEGRWPPILVRRDDHSIVDGYYRYLAAQLLGHSSIDCIYFEHDRDAAFVETIRRNVGQGLPLTARERIRAASAILRLHRDWSDRAIAELCALSPTTVGRLRSSSPCLTDHEQQLDRRRGRDGKRRPVDAWRLRGQIADAIRTHPEASLRRIAQLVGTSPETVRTVRNLRPASSTPSGLRAILSTTDSDIPAPMVANIGTDPALLATSEGLQFTQWMTCMDLGDSWKSFVDAVPLSRIYEVSDEARRRARSWVRFADALEARARGPMGSTTREAGLATARDSSCRPPIRAS
jgi:ParB-like chromosome segregation protein Spo0J